MPRLSFARVVRTGIGRFAAGWALLLASTLAIATEQPASRDMPVGTGPWVVRAYFRDKGQLHALTRRTAPWEVRHDQSYAVVEVADRQEFSRLLADGFRVSVDASLTAALRPSATESLPGFACYRTVEETVAAQAALASAHPQLASVIDIGDSWTKANNPTLGYDLSVLKLGNSAIAGPKPRMFVMGAIHAREYSTAETVMRYGESLVARYDTDADVRWMLDHHEIYLLPHANPDGRKKAELGQNWRKNVNEAYCGPTSNSRGADLNRNFPFEWGAHGGSSGVPCEDIFRGAAAASEPETAAIVNYLRTLFTDARPPDFVTPAPADTSGIFLDLHSYGNLVMWPWGFTENAAPNGNAMATLGRRMAWFNGYRPEQAIELYVTDGGTKDFAYGDLGLPGMSMELGNSFFEPCSNFENQILPANLKVLDYLLRVARRPYQEPSGPSTADILTAPVEVGETIRVVAQADDARFSQVNGVEATQPVSAVRAYFEQLPWSPGASADALAVPLDGSFNSVQETVLVELPSAGRGLGRHPLYLRASDSGANGPVSARYVDIVAAGTTARVTGVVRDAVTLQPLVPPAVLQLGAHGSASVPASGSSYSIRAPSGSYSLVVRAEGYAEKTLPGLNLVAPATTTLDVALDPICAMFEDAGANLVQFTAQSPWGPASNRFTSAPSSFTESPVGDYPNNANLALTSVPLDLRDTYDLTLSFESWCDTEAGWDFGRVEVSTDGNAWTEIWSCHATPLWTHVELPLPQLQGAAAARIRFRLTSDSNTVRDGWNIDDVRIDGAGGICSASPESIHRNGFE